MAGIYLHIPYCRKRCYYCDFHTSVNLTDKEKLIEAMVLEMVNNKSFTGDEEIETVYFGGGTPSLLNKEDIDLFLNTISNNFNLIKNPEITLEANPDDLSIKYIEDLKNTGINRLSIGIQSFDDAMLKLMNRRHNSLQAKEAVANCKKAGYNNISIDLIYGLPGQTMEGWKQAVNSAMGLDMQHISAYHLTYEPKTVFSKYRDKGKIIPISDDEGFEQFRYLSENLKSNGFEHYEISNFALKGYHSKHNSNYWSQKKYLGIGPSAHSFNGNSRQWNISNNKEYITRMFNDLSTFEIEYLDNNTIFNEYLMTSLRTSSGADIKYITDHFGEGAMSTILEILYTYYPDNYFKIKEGFLILTEQGLFISDKIISDLFILD